MCVCVCECVRACVLRACCVCACVRACVTYDGHGLRNLWLDEERGGLSFFFFSIDFPPLPQAITCSTSASSSDGLGKKGTMDFRVVICLLCLVPFPTEAGRVFTYQVSPRPFPTLNPAGYLRINSHHVFLLLLFFFFFFIIPPPLFLSLSTKKQAGYYSCISSELFFARYNVLHPHLQKKTTISSAQI